jgi:Bacterial PH domain
VTQPQSVQFGPDRRLAGAAAVGALVFLGLTLLSGDPEQRILAGLAALALAVNAGVDLYFWPRLRVDAQAITLRTPTVRAKLAWTRQPIVRVDEHSRLGLSSHTLEIDVDELLVVLSRHALGTDPLEVQSVIEAWRPIQPSD